MRKRKFSSTSLPRTPACKGRGATAATTVTANVSDPPPLNDLYQRFVLSVVDPSGHSSPEVVEQRIPLAPTLPGPATFASVLQSSVLTEDANKSTTSQVSQPIPLPPPLVTDSNLKAAGILAELITLRGSHLAAVESQKFKKTTLDKLVDNSVHNPPPPPPLVVSVDR